MTEEKRSDTFARLVAQQPDNELFRFNLAQALVAEHRYTDAVEHFRFCVRKKTDWIAARIQFSKTLLDLGLGAEARVQLQEALRAATALNDVRTEHELRNLLATLP
jgi:predicted Zn-dependent protease